MKDILIELFENPIKTKLIKLFLRNPQSGHSLNDLIKKLKIRKKEDAVLQIKKLERIKLISKINSRGMAQMWQLNDDFVFLDELSSLIAKAVPISNEILVKKFKLIKGIKVVIIGGIFLNSKNKRVDLFLVGDGVDEKLLKKVISDLEADLGKEIDYVLLSSEDFIYRRRMFDRFIEDIFEKPHREIINKLSQEG
ncbi:MAG TPA: hypothetical protein ENL06_01950 [Candidatus Portnoybacteria bacterium]|nr:hypothetical protein [Candidatus Portnoybacteria bacterium]